MAATDLATEVLKKKGQEEFPSLEVGLRSATMLQEIGWTGPTLGMIFGTVDSKQGLDDIVTKILDKYETVLRSDINLAEEDRLLDRPFWELMLPKILLHFGRNYMNIVEASNVKTPSSVSTSTGKRSRTPGRHKDTPKTKSSTKLTESPSKKRRRAHKPEKSKKKLFEPSQSSIHESLISRAVRIVVDKEKESEFASMTIDDDDQPKSQFVSWIRDHYNGEIRSSAWVSDLWTVKKQVAIEKKAQAFAVAQKRKAKGKH